MLIKEQTRIIQNIKEKFDSEATFEDLVSHFGFEIEILDPNAKVSGLYGYSDNTISINKKLLKDEKYLYDTFFHEFGHLIHEMSVDGNFYSNYKRRNLYFSQLLESERQASLIGLEFWRWKFPGESLPVPLSYFNKKDVLFLADYYKPHFENDLHTLIKDLRS